MHRGDCAAGHLRRAVFLEEAAQYRQRIVDALSPLVPVDSEHLELVAEPADADAEGEPAAGQDVDVGRQLGGEERGPVGQHDDVGQQPQALGAGGHVGEGGEDLQAVDCGVDREHAIAAIGVAGSDLLRVEEVLPDGH